MKATCPPRLKQGAKDICLAFAVKALFLGQAKGLHLVVEIIEIQGQPALIKFLKDSLFLFLTLSGLFQHHFGVLGRHDHHAVRVGQDDIPGIDDRAREDHGMVDVPEAVLGGAFDAWALTCRPVKVQAVID